MSALSERPTNTQASRPPPPASKPTGSGARTRLAAAGMSAPRSTPPQPSTHLAGYLQKLKSKSSITGSWNKRYFVLDTARKQLQYFSSEKKATLGTVPSGGVNLSDITAVRSFDLRTFQVESSGRTFMLKAADEPTKISWIAGLNAVLDVMMDENHGVSQTYSADSNPTPAAAPAAPTESKEEPLEVSTRQTAPWRDGAPSLSVPSPTGSAPAQPTPDSASSASVAFSTPESDSKETAETEDAEPSAAGGKDAEEEGDGGEEEEEEEVVEGKGTDAVKADVEEEDDDDDFVPRRSMARTASGNRWMDKEESKASASSGPADDDDDDSSDDDEDIDYAALAAGKISFGSAPKKSSSSTKSVVNAPVSAPRSATHQSSNRSGPSTSASKKSGVIRGGAEGQFGRVSSQPVHAVRVGRQGVKDSLSSMVVAPPSSVMSPSVSRSPEPAVPVPARRTPPKACVIESMSPAAPSPKSAEFDAGVQVDDDFADADWD